MPGAVGDFPTAEGRPAPARVIRDPTAWFTVGRARKAEMQRMGRCAECLAPLPPSRRSYCRDECRLRFHGRFFWDSARTLVLRRDRYTCRACGVRRRRRELEVDHILEIARGGASLDYANLQTLCRACHREKTRAFLGARAALRRAARGSERSPPVAREGPPPEADWFPA